MAAPVRHIVDGEETVGAWATRELALTDSFIRNATTSSQMVHTALERTASSKRAPRMEAPRPWVPATQLITMRSRPDNPIRYPIGRAILAVHTIAVPNSTSATPDANSW